MTKLRRLLGARVMRPLARALKHGRRTPSLRRARRGGPVRRQGVSVYIADNLNRANRPGKHPRLAPARCTSALQRCQARQQAAATAEARSAPPAWFWRLVLLKTCVFIILLTLVYFLKYCSNTFVYFSILSQWFCRFMLKSINTEVNVTKQCKKQHHTETY